MQPWQLDHQVLQADDCGRSVSFRAALGFPYLLHQTCFGVFGLHAFNFSRGFDEIVVLT